MFTKSVLFFNNRADGLCFEQIASDGLCAEKSPLTPYKSILEFIK